MRVLLFDIDGTLIRSGGAGKAAMEAGLKSAFGVKEIRDRVAYSGRTDPGIVRELLALHDIEPTDANAKRLNSAYLSNLPTMLTRMRGSVLPGIEEALRRERREAVVGLLTGNIRAGAEIKLRHFGLWDYFPFGGFADELTDRRDQIARPEKRVVLVQQRSKDANRNTPVESSFCEGDGILYPALWFTD